MKQLKIFCDGSRGYSCQIQRIEKGFIELRNEVTPYIQDANLIYSNNSSETRNQIILDKESGMINGKVIFTVLDIPDHLVRLGHFDLEKLRDELLYADAICSISKFVHSQLEYYFGINSHIIYQPMMDIRKFNNVNIKTYKVIHVGRKWDTNKRLALGITALVLAGLGEQDIGMIGSELVNFGDNLGVIREDVLGKFYYNADYCLATSHVEGLSLPVIEAMSYGCIPIVCNEMTTKEELLPREIFPEYDTCYANPQSLANFIKQFEDDSVKKQEFKRRIYTFYKNELEERFTNKGVAKKIIEIYKNLK